MNKKTIILIVLALLGLVVFYFSSPWDEEYDLGQLEIENSADTTLLYCSYKITARDCEHVAGYQIDDIICIRCCTADAKPWPKRNGVNNNCPKKIEFKSADGTCVYNASRINQDCGACPANSKGKYKCPAVGNR